MSQFKFRLRDTFHPQQNVDDFYANGCKYEGPRHFGVDWIETDGFPRVNANKRYTIESCQCVAYDRYRIEMPERYRTLGRNDVIIHETVHFLQWNTNEDEEGYIQFDGKNYREYVSQRTELEAHLVQISYILENMKDYFSEKVPEDLRQSFVTSIEALKARMDEKEAVEFLLKSKAIGLT
jgi:hypothetical protein